MLYTRCTAYTDPPQRCGVTDLCTLVRTMTTRGNQLVVEHQHRVCATCRDTMNLPPYDVAITPGIDIPITDDGTIPPIDDGPVTTR